MISRVAEIDRMAFTVTVVLLVLTGLGIALWHTSHCDEAIDECLVCLSISTATAAVAILFLFITHKSAIRGGLITAQLPDAHPANDIRSRAPPV